MSPAHLVSPAGTAEPVAAHRLGGERDRLRQVGGGR